MSFDIVTGYSENLARALQVFGKFLDRVVGDTVLYSFSLLASQIHNIVSKKQKLSGCYSTVLSKRLISVATPEYVGIYPSVLFHFSSMDAPNLYQLLTDRLSFRYLKYSQSMVLKLDCDQEKTF